jgi:hypothetical protein
MPRLLSVIGVALAVGLPAEAVQSDSAEPVFLSSGLENGDFSLSVPAVSDTEGMRRIPWWVSSSGFSQLGASEGGKFLATGPGEFARQPVAAYAPLASGIVVRGNIQGRGLVSLGSPGTRHAVGGEGKEFHAFELNAEQLFGDEEVSPRFVLELRAAEGVARWRDLEVVVPLPCPSEADLRAELLTELHWIFALWLGVLDQTGEPTAFIAQARDVVTGRVLQVPEGNLTIFQELLMDALEVEEVETWRSTYELFLEDFLTKTLHPKTGLPRPWDIEKDVPIDSAYAEIAYHMGFLLEVAERGPESLRPRALAAARKMGETVLAHGCLPTGSIAPRYRASDAAPDTNAVHLRVLDLPAQLARLSTVTGDKRFIDAAREAALECEFVHFWPGVWYEIDPGFDDTFGNIGARSIDLWRAAPEEPMFQRMAFSGFEYFAPIWRDAMQLGGNIAADQVRCWQIFVDLSGLRPEITPQVSELLTLAVRSHFKGEQYGNGAWGDVTVYNFDPQPHLQVGDVAGVPQNLTMGIASVYEERLGLRTDEMRARYTAVMRSTIATYKREFGYLSTRRESASVNPPIGSLRFAVGIVDMLRKL